MDTKLLLLKTHSKSKRGRGGSVSPISDLPYPIISIHITVMATLSSELHINKPYHRHWLASITLPDNPVMCCQCCGQTHTLFARSQSPHSSLPLYQTCKRCLTRHKLFVFVNLSLEQRCRFWCCSCVTLSVGNVEYTGWHNDMMKQWQNDRKLHRQMTVWYIRTNTQRIQLLQLSLIINWF